ncbi:MAG: DNA-protecting protein DprA [Elusimicrobia bacterium]|nr:DNA-protecting protein DprA [Elusimicrobiota bacterium]
MGLEMRAVVLGEPEYPELLKVLSDAPDPLYVAGRLDNRPAVALVGSRQPTPYGVRMARHLSGELARAGLAIVSGLARGIDTQSHQAALDAGGITWAVLGSGLDRVYPAENEALARRIVEKGGCVMSEFPSGAPPLPDHFPRRNRIIAALSWVTVVVEGRLRSGSLITARLAAELGREVLAVPGPVDSALSEAPNLLLSQGAGAAVGASAVIGALPPGVELYARGLSDDFVEAPAARLPMEQLKILECLSTETLSLEQLGHRLGIDLPSLAYILFNMELQDLIVPVPGQRYAKKTFIRC